MTQTTTEPNHAARRKRLAAAHDAEYVDDYLQVRWLPNAAHRARATSCGAARRMAPRALTSPTRWRKRNGGSQTE